MATSGVLQRICHLISSLQRGTIVICTSLFVLAAVRNSITWHLQQVWGLSHDFWQEAWGQFLNLCGEEDFLVYIFGQILLGWIPFSIYNSFLFMLDYTGKPEFLKKYKIQPNVNSTVSLEKYWSTYKAVFWGQILYGSPTMAVFYYLQKWNGISYSAELPTFQRVLFELFLFICVEEVMFYYSHRLFHHRWFYKRFHKKHHEWTAPIGITSVYAHPLELIFTNTVPVMIGPTLFCSHIATTLLWIMMALINTTNAHSGYHFPSFPSAEQHDYHHLKFNECYGLLGILDRIHGTNTKFRESQHYQRHRHFFSLTPVRELYPDPVAKNPKPHAK